MQAMISTAVADNGQVEGAKPARRPVQALADRKIFVHKRLERWIQLQQFVFGLPEDYSYAVRMRRARGSERFESQVVVNAGWMSWYGHGKGSDRQHGLAVALLNTMEALSANGTAVFFHRLAKFLGLRRRRSASLPRMESSPSAGTGLEDRLLAG